MGGNVEAYYDNKRAIEREEERVNDRARMLHEESDRSWVQWQYTAHQYRHEMLEKARKVLAKEAGKRGGR